jgi:hypothetical protein
MLGGHLDSWHGSTGAQTMLQVVPYDGAVRLLQTLGIKPKRTIRIALLSGEEEGLFGSRGYVKKTLQTRYNAGIAGAPKVFIILQPR